MLNVLPYVVAAGGWALITFFFGPLFFLLAGSVCVPVVDLLLPARTWRANAIHITAALCLADRAVVQFLTVPAGVILISLFHIPPTPLLGLVYAMLNVPLLLEARPAQARVKAFVAQMVGLTAGCLVFLT
jgi:uncharacterized membrane protein